MGDTAREEGFFFCVEKRHILDGVDILSEDVFHGVGHEFRAELDPHGDFLVVNRTLMLTKFDSLVSAISDGIDLAVTSPDDVENVGLAMAVGEIVATEGAGPLAVSPAPGGSHETVDKALEFLIVLVDVDNLLAVEFLDTNVNVKATGFVDIGPGLIESLAAILEACKALRVIIEDRGDALDGIRAVVVVTAIVIDHGGIRDELVIGPVIAMVITFVVDRETVLAGLAFDGITRDDAFNLDTEGELDADGSGALSLGSSEEASEFEGVDVALRESEFEAGLLLGGDGHVGLLNLGEGFVKGLHNTKQLKVKLALERLALSFR